jgi:hypothetical protein
MKYVIFSLLLILLSVTQVLALGDEQYNEQTTTSPQIFYVSRSGNNSTGLSWSTAWNELSRIRWDLVRPGAVIYIDGGATQMRYDTQLLIAKSGTSTAPITIRASDQTGHRGQVIFFGGRNSNLPYCGQSSYSNQAASTMRDYGIQSNGHDYVTIDGRRWRGMVIHGYRVNGIRLHQDSRNITFKNLEIYNNGDALAGGWNGGWRSDHAGVRLAGLNMLFSRVIIHDNGQDSFQSLNGANNISNFRLERSWLYNGRKHPSVNESWNYCTHTDGIQIYDGGTISGMTITESYFGPGFTQNVLLGQTTTSSGSWAAVQNVTFRDVVFSRGADNGVAGYRDTNSSNWMLDRVTIDCRETKSHCLRIYNANHTVRNSIIVNGLVTFPDGLNTYSGNCIWNTEGFDLGQEVNPQFSSVSTTNMFSLDNYTHSSSVSCQGSRIRSVSQLLAL